MTVQIIITVNDDDCADTVIATLSDAETDLMFDFPIAIQRNDADPLAEPVAAAPSPFFLAGFWQDDDFDADGRGPEPMLDRP